LDKEAAAVLLYGVGVLASIPKRLPWHTHPADFNRNFAEIASPLNPIVLTSI
jgi:hypothetical protein